jgi:hypothetical protein
MSIGAVIAAVLIGALVGATVVFALSRRRSRPAAPVPAGPPVVADELAEAEARHEPVRPREQPTLISEGEAIREQVEARLQRERPRAYEPVAPLAGHEDLAGQIERDQRDRYPSTYAADGSVAPPADVLAARDQLAWQIEQDERRRFPDTYPPSRHGLGGPIGGGLQPEMLPVSDALELQLQEIALRSRTPVAPATRPAARRRRSGFARSRRRVADADPLDPQGRPLAP